MPGLKGLITGHPVATYFGMTYLISWIGAFLVVASKLFHGEAINQLDGIIMFPIMLLGPSLAGIIMTGIVDGRSGLRNLVSRMGKWRVGAHWYAALLIPPVLTITILVALRILVSHVFTPQFYLFGIVYGVVPGFLEEIGWVGYAFPKMTSNRSAFSASIFLGLLWGLWHLPVIDFLGAAYPHGMYWVPFALCFITAMTAMRVLIIWLYSNTRSVLLAQLLHVVSTASLVVFSPAPISPAHEVLWYSLYAIVLWMIVAIVTAKFGNRFVSTQNKILRMSEHTREIP